MFILYAVCMIIFCNVSCLLGMESYADFYTSPLGRSMASFTGTLNKESDKNVVELKILNENNEQRKESPRKLLALKKNNYMHGLYYKVSNFFVQQSPYYSSFLECISAYNYGKRYGINEDLMGSFAWHHDNLVPRKRTSLFFYFLKDYNKRVAITHEIPCKKWSPLAKRLTIPLKEKNFPRAIELLIADTDKLLLNNITNYFEVASFMQLKTEFTQLSDKVVKLDNQAWKKEFLYDAFECLCSDNPHNKLNGIVIMLSNAKQQRLMQQESDLGYYALSYEPTILDTMSMNPLNVSYESQKSKISLLCSLVEKYNITRGKKITPSAKLYHIYTTIKSLHICMPDGFDHNWLDPEKISFAEYGELLEDIDVLCRSHSETIEDCVKEWYPLQLSTEKK